MRIVLLLLLSFILIACDGLDIDSTINGSNSSERSFSRAELAFNVIYSSEVLNNTGFSNREGYIVLFNSTSDVVEIELSVDDDDNAIIGNYTWTIDDDRLEVTYANGTVCTSTKTSETASEYTATATCDGSEPNNARIENTLLIPNSLEDDDFSGRSITVNNDDDDLRFDFFDGGSFETRSLDSDGDEISNTTLTGQYTDTSLNNTIRLDFDGSEDYSLFVLLDGGLSSGVILELQFTETPLPETSNDTLNQVLIHEIEENDQWETDSVYDDIDIDQ